MDTFSFLKKTIVNFTNGLYEDGLILKKDRARLNRLLSNSAGLDEELLLHQLSELAAARKALLEAGVIGDSAVRYFLVVLKRSKMRFLRIQRSASLRESPALVDFSRLMSDTQAGDIGVDRENDERTKIGREIIVDLVKRLSPSECLAILSRMTQSVGVFREFDGRENLLRKTTLQKIRQKMKEAVEDRLDGKPASINL